MSKYNQILGTALNPGDITTLIHSELIDYAFHLQTEILLSPSHDRESNVNKLNACKNEIIRRMKESNL